MFVGTLTKSITINDIRVSGSSNIGIDNYGTLLINNGTHVTISCGISSKGKMKTIDNNNLIKEADDNLYFSKNNGRARITYQGKVIYIQARDIWRGSNPSELLQWHLAVRVCLYSDENWRRRLEV